jgi:arginyl-tRNA synthetase
MTDASENLDITAGLRQSLAAAALAAFPDATLPAEINLERPKNRDHGDFATSLALVLAKAVGQPPRQVAAAILEQLTGSPAVAKAEIAGPGFINITLSTASAGAVITQILAAASKYGIGSSMAGQRVNLEFISANPTGPLHLGHTRWAAVGDALGRVLTAAGAQVTREFYINDRGVQMDLFGESIHNAAHGLPVPENGYHGEYVADLAAQVVAENPEFMALTGTAATEAFRDAGYAIQLAQQQSVLASFGTHFEVWFSEKSLYENDFFDHCQQRLRSQGHVFDQEGAVWLRTTDFGDDKDRVMIKSDGSFAYFASDSAYYISKRERGFDVLIYMLGADHHGYVGRLKALASCAGDDPEKNIEVLIGQLVKIMENGEELKLSKRAGTIITLAELVEKVGVDAARYTLIRYPVDTPMVMDVDLLRSRTNENPVYYVQYAHARIKAVLRGAIELGALANVTDFVGVNAGFNFDANLLTHERERELMGSLGEFGRIIASAAELREPHRVARYLEELAATYHRFYADCRVLPMSGEPVAALHLARLALCAATAQVIANGLELLGVSAPERM